MRRFAESAVVVWCLALIVTTLAFVLSKVEWPSWKDAFWSSWLQTIGSLAAIYAAIRVGQDQVKAAARLRRQEAHSERHSAMALARQGIASAANGIQGMIDDIRNQTVPMLRAICTEAIQEGVDTLDEALKRNLALQEREKVWEARQTAYRCHRIFVGFPDPMDAQAVVSMRAEIDRLVRIKSELIEAQGCLDIGA